MEAVEVFIIDAITVDIVVVEGTAEKVIYILKACGDVWYKEGRVNMTHGGSGRLSGPW